MAASRQVSSDAVSTSDVDNGGSRNVKDCMQYDRPRSSFRNRSALNCPKNPGHNDFISIPQFGLHHLPKKYRDQRIFDVIRVEAELNVRLLVMYTSTDRPDTDLMASLRGERVPRKGSGVISDLMWKEGPCPCHQCKESRNPKLEWAMINIHTARHIVFDYSEVRYTRVYIAHMESDYNQYSLSRGYEFVSSDMEKYRCNFKAATHDQQVYSYLKLMIKLRMEARQRCADVVNDLVAIISHPHGDVKHVTIGHWKEGNGSKYLYKTPSCPGSSGAPVIVFDMNRLSTRNPHSGDKNGLGVSGTFESTKHELLEVENDIDHESNIECYNMYCHKNPGHVGFIPITEFGLSHLPEKHRDQRIFDVIQAEAELTVRLLVKYTSTARPDGYFLAKSRGKRIRTTGSGWISGLKAKFTAVNNTKCPCRICKASDEPKMEWGMLEIRTAKHVVYDSLEAKHTDVHIFTDKNKPENKHEVYGYDVSACNEDGDYCVILAATHDLNLWNYLQTRDEHRSEMWKKCEGLTNTFAAVVSFPHGCGKYITCGEWTTRYPIGPVLYNASTCAGSGGALITMFGGIDNDHYLTHKGISSESAGIGTSTS